MANPLEPFSPPPTQEILVNGLISTQWTGWFNQVYQYLKGPFVSTVQGSQKLAPNILFFPDQPTLVSYILPSAANIGDIVTIIGKGAGGWEITQNAGQTIHSPTGSTTTGSGTLSSTNQYDAVVLICTTKNTDFSILSNTGTLTFS